MGCIYSDFEAYCSLGNVICIYEDDPNPIDSCEFYESDYMCYECDKDLNIEECICDEN